MSKLEAAVSWYVKQNWIVKLLLVIPFLFVFVVAFFVVSKRQGGGSVSQADAVFEEQRVRTQAQIDKIDGELEVADRELERLEKEDAAAEEMTSAANRKVRNAGSFDDIDSTIDSVFDRE